MKKIGYLVFSLLCMIGFCGFANAEKCQYEPVLDARIDASHYQNTLMNSTVQDSEYLFFRAKAANKFSNMQSLDFSSKAAAVEDLTGNIVQNLFPIDGRNQVKQGITSATAVYDTDADSMTISIGYTKFFDSTQLFSNEHTTQKNYNKTISVSTPSSCATAVAIAVKDDSFVVDKFLYLQDYNYDYLKMVNAGNFNDSSANILLYLSNADVTVNSNGDKQSNKGLTRAVMCTVKTSSSGFYSDAIDEVKPIIDEATKNEEYNIRKIYKHINEELSTDEAAKTIEKLSQGKALSSYDEYMIENYIYTLPYFSKSTAEEAYNMIQNDKLKLEDYKNNYSDFEKCISEAYNTELKDAISQYMKYDSDYQGLYVDAMIKLLDIFNEENIKAWYDAKKETNYVDSKKNDEECSHVPESDKKKCIENLVQRDINSINCTDLIGKTNLTTTEQILKKSLDEICSNPNDYNCYLTKCNDAKKKKTTSKSVTELVNDESDAKKTVKSSIDDFYEQLITHTGVKIESDLCNLFKEGSVIREYTDIGLNIIKIGGPILVILLTSMDGIKSITSQNEDQNKKFYSHLKIRLICVAVLFLVPTIIQTLLNIVKIPIC